MSGSPQDSHSGCVLSPRDAHPHRAVVGRWRAGCLCWAGRDHDERQYSPQCARWVQYAAAPARAYSTSPRHGDWHVRSAMICSTVAI